MSTANKRSRFARAVRTSKRQRHIVAPKTCGACTLRVAAPGATAAQRRGACNVYARCSAVPEGDADFEPNRSQERRKPQVRALCPGRHHALASVKVAEAALKTPWCVACRSRKRPKTTAAGDTVSKSSLRPSDSLRGFTAASTAAVSQAGTPAACDMARGPRLAAGAAALSRSGVPQPRRTRSSSSTAAADARAAARSSCGRGRGVGKRTGKLCLLAKTPRRSARREPPRGQRASAGGRALECAALASSPPYPAQPPASLRPGRGGAGKPCCSLPRPP